MGTSSYSSASRPPANGGKSRTPGLDRLLVAAADYLARKITQSSDPPVVGTQRANSQPATPATPPTPSGIGTLPMGFGQLPCWAFRLRTRKMRRRMVPLRGFAGDRVCPRSRCQPCCP